MFFDKPVQKLNLAQAALLAGLPQAPSQYNPFIDAGAARRRRAEVLQSMVTAGYITQAQANAAARKHLEVKKDTIYEVRQQPYVFDYIQQAVAQDLCPNSPGRCPTLTHGGLKIYTTIDLRKQALAKQAILDNESTLAEQGGPGAAAAGLASIDPTNGHILAIASSSDYSQTTFDYATQAHRQPGSSFKVFALMTLIHDYNGDPNSTYYTSKFLPAGWLSEDPTWSVHTAEDTYQGNISITKATILSDNTVYAQLAADVGWGRLDQTAHAMGITSPLDGNPSEVIGGLRDRRHPAGDGRRLRHTGQRRHPPGGHDHQQGRVPGRQLGQLRRSQADPGVPRRPGLRRHPGAQAGDHQRHRDGRRLRVPRRRQDRHRQQSGERLVRRLHPPDVDRRLGRLPAGQHPDVRRIRRRPGRPHLA